MEGSLIALAKKTLICKLAAFCKQLAKGTPLGAALRDPPQTTAAPRQNADLILILIITSDRKT